MDKIKELPLDIRNHIMSFMYCYRHPTCYCCYVCGLTLCLANKEITAIDDSFNWFYTYEFCSNFCFEYEKEERVKYKDKPLAVIKY